MGLKYGTIKPHGSQFHRNPRSKKVRIHPNVATFGKAINGGKFNRSFPKISGAY